MKIPSFLSPRRMAATDMLLIGLAIYWFMMLPAIFGNPDAATSAARFLLMPAMLLMFWVTAKKLNEVARAAAVLRQLRAPMPLWRDMSAGALRHTGLVWIFLAVGCSLQMSLPASGVSPLSGAALVSLVGLLAMARRLSAAPRVVDLLTALVGLPLLLFTPSGAFDLFGNLPGALLGILALAFPASLLMLARHWKLAAPEIGWAPAQGVNSYIDLLRMQFKRFTVLTGAGTPAESGQQTMSSLGRLTLAVLPTLNMFILAPTYVDGSAGAVRVISLTVAALLLMVGLVIRDLHWRSMLVPGGMRHGRLGFQLWFWTTAVQYAYIAIGISVVLVVLRLSPSDFWPAAERLLARHATLPLEIAFATALATTLRALPYASFWGVLVVLLTASAAYIFLGVSPAADGLGLLPLPSYLAIMACITVGLVIAANRLWTFKKLLAARNAA